MKNVLITEQDKDNANYMLNLVYLFKKLGEDEAKFILRQYGTEI